MITVRVFTHPACISCQDALNVAKDLAAEREDVEVELTSLATERGQELAQRRGILVVPTIQVGEETVQTVPTREELTALVDRAGTST